MKRKSFCQRRNKWSVSSAVPLQKEVVHSGQFVTFCDWLAHVCFAIALDSVWALPLYGRDVMRPFRSEIFVCSFWSETLRSEIFLLPRQISVRNWFMTLPPNGMWFKLNESCLADYHIHFVHYAHKSNTRINHWKCSGLFCIDRIANSFISR